MATALDLPGAERLLRLIEDLTDRGADPDAAAILAAEGPALVERLRQAAEGGADLWDEDRDDAVDRLVLEVDDR